MLDHVIFKIVSFFEVVSPLGIGRFFESVPSHRLLLPKSHQLYYAKACACVCSRSTRYIKSLNTSVNSLLFIFACISNGDFYIQK